MPNANTSCDNSDKMVTISYRGYFDDGSVFIEAPESAPIHFPCTTGWMPPAFVDTVRTMRVGETRCARVDADQAYEEDTDERVVVVERETIPEGTKLEVGKMVNLESPDGQTYPAKLTALTDTQATFDMNHSAICKALNFEITLMKVENIR